MPSPTEPPTVDESFAAASPQRLDRAAETLRAAGFGENVDSRPGFVSVRAQAGDAPRDIDAQIRLGATPDVVLSRARAVTEQGHPVIVSAGGSRLSPYASGPAKRPG